MCVFIMWERLSGSFWGVVQILWDCGRDCFLLISLEPLGKLITECVAVSLELQAESLDITFI